MELLLLQLLLIVVLPSVLGGYLVFRLTKHRLFGDIAGVLIALAMLSTFSSGN